MKIGINQFCWPMTMDILDIASRSKQLGFESLEVCFTAGSLTHSRTASVTDTLDISAYYNRLLNIESGDNDFYELKRISDDSGISFGSIGGIISFSIYPLTSPDRKVYEKCNFAIRRMIDAANILGAKTVQVIPGMLTSEMDYERTFDLVQSRLADLAAGAGGINLAIENVWNNFLYSPLEINRLIDETGQMNLGVYFDIGNARRFGYPEQWIRTLGHRIKMVHCKDYRMSVDNIHGFTNLLDGDVNYPAVITALNEAGFHGDFILELIPPARYEIEMTFLHGLNVLKTLLNRK